MNEEYLRKLIREVIRRELDETTTTANVGGYLTPRAFAGKASVYRKKIRAVAEKLGWKLTKGGKEALDAIARDHVTAWVPAYIGKKMLDVAGPKVSKKGICTFNL